MIQASLFGLSTIRTLALECYAHSMPSHFLSV